MLLIVAAGMAGLVAGSGRSASRRDLCRGGVAGSQGGVRVLGHAVADMDGDGRLEEVSVRADDRRPVRCRYVLVVRQGAGLRTRVLAVSEPDAVTQGREPFLVGVAGIARGKGVQAIVDSRCCGAYVSGQWLFRETNAGLWQMHVRPPNLGVSDTFPNGASLCCGDTPVCGSDRGIVVVFGEGRNAKPIDEAEVFVQRGNTFRNSGRKRLRRPGRLDDFRNCRPWVAAR